MLSLQTERNLAEKVGKGAFHFSLEAFSGTAALEEWCLSTGAGFLYEFSLVAINSSCACFTFSVRRLFVGPALY
jgi:hypothetical protein